MIKFLINFFNLKKYKILHIPSGNTIFFINEYNLLVINNKFIDIDEIVWDGDFETLDIMSNKDYLLSRSNCNEINHHIKYVISSKVQDEFSFREANKILTIINKNSLKLQKIILIEEFEIIEI